MQVVAVTRMRDSSAKHRIDAKTMKSKTPKVVVSCVLLSLLSSGMTQVISFHFSINIGGLLTMVMRGIFVLANKTQTLSNLMLLFVWFHEV